MLSDLTVFQQYLRTGVTELLTQKVRLFNEATDNALQLVTEAHAGDFADQLLFAALPGMVKRRNPYGTGTLAEKHMTNLTATSVKVGSGTYPIEMDKAQFAWILQDQRIAAAAMSQQLALQILQDMVNTAVGVVDAAVGQIANLVYDNTGAATPTLTPISLSNASFKFGDHYSDIAVWIMHSKVLGDFFANALTGSNYLFTYGTVNVIKDPWGRKFVCSDIPNLIKGSGGSTTYDTLGLVPGAVQIMQNDDWNDNWDTRNGYENIHTTYQAEWSWNIGMKGFQWDKTNGGKAPTDASLFVATNWDRYATSDKDLPGVILRSK